MHLNPSEFLRRLLRLKKVNFIDKYDDDRLNLKTQFNDLADHNLVKNIEFHCYPILLRFRGGSDIADHSKKSLDFNFREKLK